ncbi:hypothetical protein CANMA_004470 [Candida margitis]|uniref:uncharacterized protein n=1 Tax=Candida margitis TaxID=1775924 RepID=UPI00222631D9|nr:uncharacterized protein CANMA_004470 [Candida margitis]KAI5956633.1 hypothetical protein CANMA_004470 [Candida margitis]
MSVDKGKVEEKVAEFVSASPATEEKDIASSGVEDYVVKFFQMSEDAHNDDQREKHMSLMEGIKTFPKAIAWSMVLSTALIMEGYDSSLLSGLYAHPGFRKKFGDYYPEINQYQIPTKWQTGLSMSYQSSQFIGLWLAAILSDRFGYRKTLMPILAVSVSLIFIQFFAPNRSILLLGYILLGIDWGSYQTITVIYAAEIAPACLRLYLTTYINICWIIGQLIAGCVLKGISGMNSPNVYLIAFGIQWIWPIPIIIGIYLAPESPYFLVRKGRLQEAKRSLSRILTANSYLTNNELVAESLLNRIQLVVREEDATFEGTSFKECFTGTNLRRTRIAATTWVFQKITGAGLMNYSTYFYEQVGLATSNAFTLTIVQYCLGLIGTIGSWFVSQKLGRFSILFGGLCTMTVLLFIVGGLGFLPDKAADWGIGTLLLVFVFVYDLSVGPMIYCIGAEIPSVKLRQKTIMLARFLYNVAGIIVSILSSYMLNPTAWNWKAKAGFLWGGLAAFAAIITWIQLPETKGRTFAELDKLFEQGVGARKFKYTIPSTFDASEMRKKMGEAGIKNIIKERKNIDDKSGSKGKVETTA